MAAQQPGEANLAGGLNTSHIKGWLWLEGLPAVSEVGTVYLCMTWREAATRATDRGLHVKHAGIRSCGWQLSDGQPNRQAAWQQYGRLWCKYSYCYTQVMSCSSSSGQKTAGNSTTAQGHDNSSLEAVACWP